MGVRDIGKRAERRVERGERRRVWKHAAQTAFVLHDRERAGDAVARARGRRLTRVKRITTADYPTPARRPANSRLDNAKLRLVYELALPDWRASVAECCARLIP